MQSSVLGFVYRSISDRLDILGKTSGLFSYHKAPAVENEDVPTVSIFVTDICQIVQDKNGQRIVVDELRYELPSLISVSIGIVISGKDYDRILDVTGLIAGSLKDNPFIDAGAFNWHGNTGGRIYVEPVIRCPSRTFSYNDQHVVLEYRFEAGINSGHGEAFTRVEKREVRSEVM